MILIKIGGGESINWDWICQDIGQLVKTEKVVIVHGANAKRDALAKQLGHETRKITSPSGVTSTYTDEKSIDVFLMSYAGLVNKRLVALLQKHYVNAVGLSGIDGKLLVAKQKKQLYSLENGKTKLIEGSFTGRVETVNKELLELLIDHSYVPVVCPPAISYENIIVNTDNDWVVAMIAGALGIEKVVSLFEAPGMLKDPQDPSSIIKVVKNEDLDSLIPFAKGTMKKKVLGAKKAFELGVKKMYWSDGRIEKPITKALLGSGTVII